MKNLLAQLDYTPLAPIDKLKNEAGNVDIGSFLTNIVPLIIGVAGGLAVIMIVVGGIKYMTTDAMMGKKEARGTIQNAFLGLLLAISSYVLLNTVNPALVNLDLRIQAIRPPAAIDPNRLNADGKTEKSAADIGCPNCRRIDVERFTVAPNACTNDPCYATTPMISYLVGISNNMKEDGERGDDDYKPFVAWQISRALPPTNATPSDPECFKERTSRAGRCVHISLPNPSVDNLIRLLKYVNTAKSALAPTSQSPTGYRVTSVARQNELKSNLRSRLREMNTSQGEIDFYEGLIKCRQPIVNNRCADNIEYLYLENAT